MIAILFSFALAATTVQASPGNLKLDLAKARRVFTKECKPLLEPWVGGKLPIGNGVVLFDSGKSKRNIKFVIFTILLDSPGLASYEKKCLLKWAWSMFGLDGVKTLTKHLVLIEHVDLGRYGDKVRGLFFYTKKYMFQGMKRLKIMVIKL